MDDTSSEPFVDPNGSSSQQELRSYARALWAGRWLVAGVTAFVVAVVAVYTARQPSIYEATTSVVIDMSAPRVLDDEVQGVINEEKANYWLAKEYAQTQLHILESRAVASRVVEKLGLQHDAEFLGLEKVADPQERAEKMARLDAVEVLRTRLTVSLMRDSRLALIQVEDRDPKRAALLSNEVAEAYIAESLALKLKVTESASVWLEERLKELETKSKSSELAVYEFKKTSDVLTTELENKLSIISERLNAYNVALTQVRTRIAELRARVQSIQQLRKASPEDRRWAEGLPLAESRLLDEMRQRLFATRADCAEITERYLAQHPKLTACKERLETLEADIQRELDNRIKATESELAAALGNERNLVNLLDAAKREAFDFNRKQIEFERLQRDAANDRRLYDIVLKRLKDIELSGLLRTSNVRVLDQARPPERPVRPRKARNLALAAIGGLLLGALVALGRSRLDSSLKTQTDVEEALRLPVLGVFPRLPGEKQASGQERDLLTFRVPTSIAAECGRAIRTNLLFAAPDSPWTTLVVTSSGPAEGKSTLAISLGIAMARSGGRVLLVDADLRRPRLHRAFGVTSEVGLSSLVVGEGHPEDAIKSTEVPGLSVLTSGPQPPNPAELLQSQAFHELLTRLAGRFDRVILDSPPVGAVVDAVVLGTQVDGVVMVVKAQRTPREHAQRSLRALQNVNARVLGAVLNDVDLSAGDSDYYLSYQTDGQVTGTADAPTARSA